MAKEWKENPIKFFAFTFYLHIKTGFKSMVLVFWLSLFQIVTHSLFIFLLKKQGTDAFSQSGLYSNHQDIAPRYSVSTTCAFFFSFDFLHVMLIMSTSGNIDTM